MADPSHGPWRILILDNESREDETRAWLAGTRHRVVRYEIARSKRVTLQAYRETSWWRRLVNRLAWLLRWWL